MGLRDHNSPTCTLSQNGYGDGAIPRFGPPKMAGRGGAGRLQKEIVIVQIRSPFSASPIGGLGRGEEEGRISMSQLKGSLSRRRESCVSAMYSFHLPEVVENVVFRWNHIIK